jgi:hypothetical protein
MLCQGVVVEKKSGQDGGEAIIFLNLLAYFLGALIYIGLRSYRELLLFPFPKSNLDKGCYFPENIELWFESDFLFAQPPLATFLLNLAYGAPQKFTEK